MGFKKSRILFFTTCVGLFTTACLMVVPTKPASSALTSGSPPHTHTGVTTGGSTLTSPIINTASIISPTITGASYTGTQTFSAVDVTGHLTGLTTNFGGGRLASNANGTSVYGDFAVANDANDGSDNGYVSISSATTLSHERGAYLQLNGNEASSNAGLAELTAGASGSATLRAGTGTGPTPSFTLAFNSSGVLTSSRACDAGYTRLAPNYCLKSNTTTQAMTAGTCVVVTAPTGSTAIDIYIISSARSANVANTSRESYTMSYTSSACTVSASHILTRALAVEVNAVVNTPLSYDTNFLTLPTVSNSLFLKATNVDAGNNSETYYSVQGYYD